MSLREISRSEPTALLLRPRLEHLVRQVEARADEVREERPEAIHRLRLSVRRLRSLLTTFGGLLDEQQGDTLRDELSWLGDTLGAARDAEVTLSRLLLRLEDFADLRGVEEAAGDAGALWRGRYQEAHDAVVVALGSERFEGLMAALHDLAAEPSLHPRAARMVRRMMPELLRQDVDRLQRRMSELPEADHPDYVERLHRARKAAKRVRYTAEAGGPAYGGTAKRLARAMRDYSSRLGEHHDVAMAREAVDELVGRAAPDAAEAWGRIDEVEARLAEEIADQVPHHWRRARKSLRLEEWES